MSVVGLWRDRVVELRTCRESGRILQSYLDGELDEARVRKVEEHLEHCRRCGMEVDTYTRIKATLRGIGRDGRVHPEDELSLERLRRFAEGLGS